MKTITVTCNRASLNTTELVYVLPQIEQNVFAPYDMDIDSGGNLYFSSFPTTSAGIILKVKPDHTYSYQKLSTVMAIRAVKTNNSTLGYQPGDVLALQSTGNLDSPSSQMIYKIHFGDDGKNEMYAISMLLHGINLRDFVIGPQGSLYAIGTNPLQLYRLVEEGSWQPVCKNVLPPDAANLKPYKLEYFPAQHQFYVLFHDRIDYLPYSRHELLQISEDGQSANLIKAKTPLRNMTVDPAGNSLYLINQYRGVYGAVQLIRYVNTANPTPTFIPVPGDIDRDGKLDSQDIQLLLNAFIDTQIFTEEELSRLDVNGDGTITPQDAQDLWLQIYQKK